MSENPNATTDYGTWYTINGDGTDKPREVILNVLGDQADGYDVDAIESEYRSAINAALPGSVTLSGTLFYGPYERPDWDAAGYPVDPMGTLDIKAIIDGIDVVAIAAKHDWGLMTKPAPAGVALPRLLRRRAELVDQLGEVHREIATAAIEVAANAPGVDGGESAEAELQRMAAADPAIAAALGIAQAAGSRADVVRLVAELVAAHRATIEPALRGMAGDALDLDLRRAGIACMRRHGTKIALAIVPPDGSERDEDPRTMDTDEVEEVALSLLTAVVDARAAEEARRRMLVDHELEHGPVTEPAAADVPGAELVDDADGGR